MIDSEAAPHSVISIWSTVGVLLRPPLRRALDAIHHCRS
jgi:hypothetical protein